MLKNVKNKSASILLLVVVLASSLSVLFMTISFMSNQYLKQVSSIEYWNLAENYAESWIEEWIVRYFENSEKKYQDYENCTTWTCAEIRRKNILYSNISKNEYFDFRNDPDWDPKNIPEKIFLSHKWIFWINSEDQIWNLEVNASRLVDKIEWKLYPYEKFEFRLTAEEREKYKYRWKEWHQSDIKQLKLVWNKLNWDTNDAKIKILQIRWPIWQTWNIQTHKIIFKNWWNYTFWDFWWEKDPEDSMLNLPTDEEYLTPSNDSELKKYEYIYILESSVSPLVFELYWLDWTWSTANKIKLPDKNVYFESKVNIWWHNHDLWWENSWKVFNKILKAKKEIYTNFDSNFDYARNFVNF